MTADFLCCECGRLRTTTADEPQGGLCLSCLFQPGWFREPICRKRIAPDHDGLEVCERDAPTPIPFGDPT